jgi:predicted DNA-binding protein with PD1-like motif
VFMGTLTDGVLLHDSLKAVARKHLIDTATFDLLGGLREATFTPCEFASHTASDPLIIAQPLEIVAGHGTISLMDDDLHVHCHVSASVRNADALYGIAMVGGHVTRAICTVVEFTLTVYDGAPLERITDDTTGLKLWDVPDIRKHH